jgi:peptidoglycan/LPS O-acetylase OafA/YrhL
MSGVASVGHGLDVGLAPARAHRLAMPARPAAVAGDSARIEALDGLRGLLAMMVCISHYFGEVAHGIPAVMAGWIGVKVFFVLSGFLMTRIILTHMSSPNFASVFYMRRICRTLPVYLVTIAIIFVSLALFRHAPWMEAERFMPLWSYLTFTQSFVMIARGDFGSDWQTPTWTLTVEEQFYLIAPVICLLTPRRYLLRVLIAGAIASVMFRALAYGPGVIPPMAALVLLPGAAHSMLLGMIAALLLMSPRIDWARYELALRVAPIVCLLTLAVTVALDDRERRLFNMIGVPMVSVAAAVYLMGIVRGTPEAERLKSKNLGFLGQLSYSIYLLHMPVLGLMHGLILAAKPDIATPEQIAVTVVAVPMAVVLAWGVNRTIEQPMIAYGRLWKWRKPGVI